MELSLGHYWILDAIFDGGVRLEWLLTFPEALRLNYFTEPSPLTERELSLLLVDLTRWGLATIYHDRWPYAEITPAGGAAWEAWAEPDWSLYFNDDRHEHFPSEDEECDLTIVCVRIKAANEGRLAQAMSHLSDLYQGQIHGQTDIVTRRRWKVTIWKVLPTCVVRSFLIKPDDIPVSVRTQRHLQHLQEPHVGFRRWRKRGFNSGECFELVCWE